jgi:hypothetical protein
MSRRLRIVVVSAAFLGSGLIFAPAGRAESSTVCVGRADIIQITPGWSMEQVAGTGTTVVDGTQDCSGPLEGHHPTGTMRTHHEFVYRTLEGCGDLDVKGLVDYSIPTADGVVHITNNFVATLHPSSDPPGKSGTFEGDHASGRFFLRPIEGDCVHAPLTRFEAGWVATWSSQRRS